MHRTKESQAFRRILKYLRRYWIQIGCGVVVAIVSSLLGVAQPLLMRAVVDDAIPNRQWDLLVLLASGLAIVPLARLVLGTLETLWITGTAQKIARELRVDLVDHLLRMPISFYTANTTGELMSRVVSDCGRLAEFMSKILIPSVSNLLQLLILAVVLLRLDATLALLIFAVFPVGHICATLIGRRLTRIESEWRGVRGSGSTMLQELLTGVRTIKSFTREPQESARWAAWNALDMRLWLRHANWSQILAATAQIMTAIGIAIVMGYGGWQVAGGNMSFGTLLAFFAFTPQFYLLCGALIESRVEIGVLESYMARVFEILDMPAEPHADRALDLPTHGGCEITFEQVSFSYEDERQGIRDMSFHIARGEYVAFVGPSGSGKSTLLDLLMGFYAPHSGRILIDGVDSRNIPLERLRRTVALVSQEVHVWNTSILDNLRYANDNITEEHIRAAVKAAQLADFIKTLPAGLNTEIGERGVRLSGGERQRLSIARASLRNPRVLLLDEVTAALDALTERALQEGMHAFLRGRTVLAVAHRLSTIRDCDRIIVIADGHIVQEGSHDILMSRAGLYRDLYEAQYQERPAL